MRRAATVGALLVLLSCSGEAPMRPQWLVTVRTDAPVPLVADRLLVEVVREDGALACDTCRRLFDAGDPASWPVSFGVAATQTPLRVRARLHRARRIGLDGAPDAESSIDAVAALPSGPGPVALELHMRCFGLPSTDTASCAAETGELTALPIASTGLGDRAVVPGAWSEATSAPCAGDAPEGMACVPGGLFFFRGFEREEGGRDKLVRLSSFFLDREEMTVGRARAIFARGGPAARPGRYTPGRRAAAVCAYRDDGDGSADALSLNCIDRALARSLCAAEGKRLPTDAELAYASGNGGQGSRYPWGDDEEICAHAVVARGAVPLELEDSFGSLECRTQGTGTLPFGPVTGGAPTDATLRPEGIRDLGGNLSEWVEDDFARLGEPCWTGRPLLVDPVCRTTDSGAVLRGGAWDYEAWTASATFRMPVTPYGSNAVGFRCARNAR